MDGQSSHRNRLKLCSLDDPICLITHQVILDFQTAGIYIYVHVAGLVFHFIPCKSGRVLLDQQGARGLEETLGLQVRTAGP